MPDDTAGGKIRSVLEAASRDSSCAALPGHRRPARPGDGQSPRAVLERVAAGRSGLVLGDGRVLGAPWARYLGYLAELVRTAPGRALLHELDTSRHVVRVVFGDTNETIDDAVSLSLALSCGCRNLGTGSTVVLDESLTSFALPGETAKPWMSERQKFGFFHELVHAYHDARGTAARGEHQRVQSWEWQALGLGPYADEPVSENAIRSALGKPLRPSYGGVLP